MNNSDIQKSFKDITTALIADSCVKLQVPFKIGLPAIKSLIKGTKIAGFITPVKHTGSVDVFFKVLESCEPGNILYIDNQGRTDEACIGDLTVLEVKNAGLIGMVVWGLHRDSVDLDTIGFPVFSAGSMPVGPRRTSLKDEIGNSSSGIFFGTDQIFPTDVLFGDDDGIIILDGSNVSNVLEQAHEIYAKEREQVEKISQGISLREQFKFSDYLLIKKSKAHYSFRDHLHQIGGAIEE